ncbi:ATP-binding cassette domain-containing protein [Archangium sp. miwbw1]|uniref:ATP-binding cassette domain-containing protein n=1 Tax=Archangium lansingense TaxID=2995310 RepID=A0ABT3ZVL8_9BACT|nr:ATP-binding cassette domain-containing protein [Archangium lansinium]MCY1073458.1 ATP-binding cassette domain-containing protein [Archangium lansinium]
MERSPPTGWQAMDAALAPEPDTFVPPRALSLRQFILRLREAHARGGIQAIEEVLRQGQLHRRAVEPFALLREGRYTRTLVYRDEDLEVLVLGWGRGARAPIHGHDGQECFLMTVAGELEVSDYRLVAGGQEPGYALVERMGPRRTLLPGAMDHRNPEMELHSVRTGARSGFAISLHVYSRPIDQCLTYDPRRSSCELRKLHYDRVMRLADPTSSRSPPPTARLSPGRLARLWRSLFRRVQEVKETVKETLVPARVGEDSAKIAVKRVEHRYANKVVALQDVNLNIRSGEFVCLLGPSGCGKSTLLYALAGQISPTGGQVRIDGKPIAGPGPDRLLMFQDAALFPWLSVRQNIEFVLSARGMSRAERSERARRFIRYVQLEGFEDAMPHELSGGMKMRTALARALAVDSPVLLMDEPFGSLDAQTRVHMHELLQRVWLETHKTIVFVTHDVTEALVLANRVVVMAPRPGRILRDLEVRLPMPRGPDDVELVGLARQIRSMLRESDSMSGTRPGAREERGTHHEGVAPGTEAAVPRGTPGGLGAAGPVRPMAAPPVPGPEGSR